MKFKIEILLCLIVFLLSLTCVSAETFENESVTGLQSFNSDFVVEDILTQTYENYTSVSAGTFDDLQAEINKAPAGSVLILNRDYNGAYGSRIQLNKNLIIDGQGHTLDCMHEECSAFYSSSGTITLKNLKIINGHNDYNYNGGAIHIEGSAEYTIENCVFKDNWADDNGGAIYNDVEKTLRLINCTFISNEVNDGDGGAVWSAGILNVDSCTFDKNTADNFGGAIYASTEMESLYGYEHSINIINSIFTSNSANDKSGGAVYSNGGVHVHNSIFRDNVADDKGGAICHNLVINAVVVDNSTFIGNQAYYGGAIDSYSLAKIDNSTFIGNYAESDGGAVKAELVEIETFSKSKSFFIDNKAGRDGGAVYGRPYIYNTVFIRNTAAHGGALYNLHHMTVGYCLFENNKATGSSLWDGLGGAICAHNGDVHVYSCTFKDNYAADYGGAIYGATIWVNDNQDDNQPYNTFFIHNTVGDNNGGALYAYEESGADDEILVKNAAFINNTAYEDGGAICSSDNLYITHCLFENNKAVGAVSSQCEGGAVKCNEILTVRNSIFRNNYADDNGGAVYTGEIKDVVSSSIFENNKANDDDGGAIYVFNSCNPVFSFCRFEKNSCGDEGGAIYFDSRNAEPEFISCSFIDNSAEDKGQSVYCCGDYKSISSCWYGTNSPSFTDQFKIWHLLSADEDYIPNTYSRINLKLEDEDLYKGNPYKLTLYFYEVVNGHPFPDKPINPPLPHGEVLFSGDENFTDTDDDLSKYVTFTRNNATMYASLNHETVSLSVYTQNKTATSVEITSCGYSYKDETLIVYYRISNNANPLFEIKNTDGFIVKKGNCTNPYMLVVKGLDVGKYNITIINPESWYLDSSNATADFIIKRQVEAVISADNVAYGTPTTLILKSNWDGKYNVSLNDIVVEVDVINGTGESQVMLNPGTYKTHTTINDDNVLLNVEESYIYVSKDVINMNVEMSKSIAYPDSVSGIITTNVPGKYELNINKAHISKIITLTNESYEFNLGPITPTSYVLRLIPLEVDERYDTSPLSTSFKVIKGTPSITLDIQDTDITSEVYAYAHSSVDGTYTLKIDGIEKTIKIVKNVGKINLGYMDPGTYNAVLTFKSNVNYNAVSYTTSFTVFRFWYVDVAQSSGGNGQSPDSAFSSVKDALNVCSDGDIIYVASGRYVGLENVNLTIDKKITIKSYGDDVIFDAENHSQVFIIDSNSIILDGLTFMDGVGEYGGALHFNNPICNSFINATFVGNHANCGGAIFFSDVCNSVISGTFIKNIADVGGANFFAGIVSDVVVDGFYTLNRAPEGGANFFGDAISNVTVDGTYTQNCAEYGGANFFRGSSVNLTVLGVYDSNVAEYGPDNYFYEIGDGGCMPDDEDMVKFDVVDVSVDVSDVAGIHRLNPFGGAVLAVQKEVRSFERGVLVNQSDSKSIAPVVNADKNIGFIPSIFSQVLVVLLALCCLIPVGLKMRK